MKNRSVVYLMSGPAHLPYLVVSLRSLIPHWGDFDIRIYAWPESYPLVKRMMKGTELQVFERIPEYRGKNSQFIDKIKLMNTLDCKVGLYLDADTIIQGEPDVLFELGERYGFCMTQFNDWGTKGGVIRNRIKRLNGRLPINQDWVESLLTENWPSVNGGIFSCTPNNQVLDNWYKWTMVVRDIFIADETVLHTMLVGYGGSKATVECSARFNCSPKYQPKSLSDEEVIIWHGHGDSFIRPNKSPKGVKLWWTAYQDIIDVNAFNISEWKDTCLLERGRTARYLRELESTPDNICRYCGQDLIDGHNSKCPLYATS